MATPSPIAVAVPKMLPITGSWTLPFAAYLMVLSGRVVSERLKSKSYFGEKSGNLVNGQDVLELASRAHGNFVENVPLALILAAVAELNGANKKGLNYTLGALLAARVLHVELGLRAQDGNGSGRVVGYYGTQSVVTGLAAYTAYLVKGYWGY